MIACKNGCLVVFMALVCEKKSLCATPLQKRGNTGVEGGCLLRYLGHCRCGLQCDKKTDRHKKKQ